jgi:gamma-glutamylcyclotransferase (GGCT)/AIG2-like uncharacterized protein YtfP
MTHDLLFVYGTLKSKKNQLKVIGRVVPGKPDILRGYMVVDSSALGGKYPVIIEDSESYVEGLVIEVTPAELDQIDTYETDAYRREKRPLQSGRTAWVYLKA